jgi:hypothetical protein
LHTAVVTAEHGLKVYSTPLADSNVSGKEASVSAQMDDAGTTEGEEEDDEWGAEVSDGMEEDEEVGEEDEKDDDERNEELEAANADGDDAVFEGEEEGKEETVDSREDNGHTALVSTV